MKLWQKTYLLSTLLCALILYGCMFGVTAPALSVTVKGATDAALREERVIAGTLERTMDQAPEGRQLPVMQTFLEYYAGTGLYFEARQDGAGYSSLPFAVDKAPGTLGFLRDQGRLYLFVSDKLPSGYDLAVPVRQRQASLGLRLSVPEGRGGHGRPAPAPGHSGGPHRHAGSPPYGVGSLRPPLPGQPAREPPGPRDADPPHRHEGLCGDPAGRQTERGAAVHGGQLHRRGEHPSLGHLRPAPDPPQRQGGSHPLRPRGRGGALRPYPTISSRPIPP